MTWMQQLAEKLAQSRLQAFAWLLNMVMRPWRDRELAYGLFAHATVLKEYGRMVRMAEELLRSLIRDAARNIKFYEFHPPEPAKSSFTIPPIGKIMPIPNIKADFHFRMKEPFPHAAHQKKRSSTSAVRKKQEPDLTLIGLKLMCRASAVEKAVYQVKKYAWRYAYCQARRKLRQRAGAGGPSTAPAARYTAPVPAPGRETGPAPCADSS